MLALFWLGAVISWTFEQVGVATGFVYGPSSARGSAPGERGGSGHARCGLRSLCRPICLQRRATSAASHCSLQHGGCP